ncbi:hypothetical protein, unlikely [Trypanosoma brucei gambiense DAL972]|uniref:Uncharacterized protein n=1 Tax=Trypanosoma brucei gambiense (strain MHOM/CI/86/DAL972) TaxID=679716 RepID=C9ZTE6_TRYB9|nr:hypothetical protein, unlikely [Trypanosoma brucei gambiense DAL972]CBH12681.1 hypothetical protein, unlikely [Trypanosoma brucei gambiense DAL972]|eukprot:XP_011774961.1 hypothetical protein, unlikely [Trypanosoma brucei gambiense DAL972]
MWDNGIMQQNSPAAPTFVSLFYQHRTFYFSLLYYRNTSFLALSCFTRARSVFFPSKLFTHAPTSRLCIVLTLRNENDVSCLKSAEKAYLVCASATQTRKRII